MPGVPLSLREGDDIAEMLTENPAAPWAWIAREMERRPTTSDAGSDRPWWTRWVSAGEPLSGRSVTYGYNTAGFETSQADSNGDTTLYTPDSAGRDTKIVDPAGRSVDYGYDGSGDVTSVTDPGSGDTWTYHYNARDLLDRATDPTGASTD